MTASKTGPAVLMVLGSCSSLQFGAALASKLFPHTGAAGATLLRLGLAGVLLLAVARPKVRRWTRRQWLTVLVFGAAFAGMNGFFYQSLTRVPLGIAVTIEFLGPLTLAAVLSRRVRDLAWVALAAGGVAVLGLAGGGPGGRLDPVGVAFVVAAGVFWAGYIVLSAKVGALIPGRDGLAVAVGVGALLLLPVGAPGASHVGGHPELWALAVGTALLASIIPYSLELAALRRLPASVFGVLLSLEPAVAALAGWLLLSQALGWTQLAGIAVVVAASVGSTLTAKQRPAPVEEPVQAPALAAA